MPVNAKLVRVGTVTKILLFIAGLVGTTRAVSILGTNGVANVLRTGAASVPQTAAHLQRALASSSATDFCSAEFDACSLDSACITCSNAYSSALTECAASLFTSSPCEDFQAALCCAVDGCTGNETFEEYVDCVNANSDSSCGITVGECSSDTAVSGSDSGTTADPTSDGSSTPVTTTDTSESECLAEVSACSADAACSACTGSYNDGLDGCAASLTTDAFNCANLEEIVCCAADGCEDNELFSTLVACDVEVFGCDLVSVEECVADGSRGITASDDLTSATDPPSDVIPTTTSSSSGATSDSDLSLTDPSTSATESPTTSLTSGSDPTTTDATGTTSDTDPCLDELDGCDEGTECMACLNIMSAAAEACQGPDYDPDTATCSEKLDAGCCAIADDLDCANNALLGAYLDCHAAESGCDISITDCLAVSSGTSLVADEGEGGDDDGGSAAGPFPVTDDGEAEEDQEATEDADAANTNGSSATAASFVFGRGAVLKAAALLLTTSATTNLTWHLLK